MGTDLHEPVPDTLISLLAGEINLPPKGEETAHRLYQQTWEQDPDVFEEYEREIIGGTCVLLSARMFDTVTDADEIASHLPDSTTAKTVYTVTKAVKNANDIGYIERDISPYVEHLAAEFDTMNATYVEEAKIIANDLMENNKTNSHTSKSIAAASLYLAGIASSHPELSDVTFSQREIAERCGVSPSTLQTIRKRALDDFSRTP